MSVVTKARRGKPKSQSINTGRESDLWRTADALRCSMDRRVQYVLLGLIFLKYISWKL